MNIRWEAPFSYSLAHDLFIQHLTELNKLYWSHVPAANTIEKKAMVFYETNQKTPKDFFLLSDENDHRMAASFEEWKCNYRNFSNFTRLNMIMALSSSFEIYMRSIISLSIESKPGIILGNSRVIDGVTLLKQNKAFLTFDEKTYPFYKQVYSVCKGTWESRIASYKQLFGNVPLELENNVVLLDSFRKTRNDIGHYFGRHKNIYETNVRFKAEPMNRISHERLVNYLQLIYQVVNLVDQHLYNDFIGAYELIKYYEFYKTSEVTNYPSAVRAKWLQKLMGHQGIKLLGTEYYKNLMKYYDSL